MSFISLEYNTPSVYTEESRDFQTILRVYNAAFNETLNDVDLITYLTDNRKIKTELLEYVKSRVGYFTNYNVSSDLLRKILSGYPELIKNKGSIQGVREATNIFLKAFNIKADIVIYYSDTGVSVQQTVDDHNIIIGISELVENYDILEDLLSYIVPAGFSISFFFFKDYNKYDWLRDIVSSDVVLIGDAYIDSIRYNFYDQTKQYEENDIVIYDDKVYKCLSQNTGNLPDESPDYWSFDKTINSLLTAANTLGVYSNSTGNSSFTEYANKVELLDDEGYTR